MEDNEEVASVIKPPPASEVYTVEMLLIVLWSGFCLVAAFGDTLAARYQTVKTP